MHSVNCELIAIVWEWKVRLRSPHHHTFRRRPPDRITSERTVRRRRGHERVAETRLNGWDTNWDLSPCEKTETCGCALQNVRGSHQLFTVHRDTNRDLQIERRARRFRATVCDQKTKYCLHLDAELIGAIKMTKSENVASVPFLSSWKKCGVC